MTNKLSDQDIEKVARAICYADGCDPDAIGCGMGVNLSNGTTYPLWKARIKQAQTALESINYAEMKAAVYNSIKVLEEFEIRPHHANKPLIADELRPFALGALDKMKQALNKQKEGL